MPILQYFIISRTNHQRRKKSTHTHPLIRKFPNSMNTFVSHKHVTLMSFFFTVSWAGSIKNYQKWTRNFILNMRRRKTFDEMERKKSCWETHTSQAKICLWKICRFLSFLYTKQYSNYLMILNVHCHKNWRTLMWQVRIFSCTIFWMLCASVFIFKFKLLFECVFFSLSSFSI